MTIKQIISLIKLNLNDVKGDLDDRHLITLFETRLATYVKNYLNKNLQVANSELVVKLKINHDANNKYNETFAIPKLIRNNHGYSILNASFDIFFQELLIYKRTIEELSKSGIFYMTSGFTYYTIHDDKIILNNRVNPAFLLQDYVYIKGYFERPSEVMLLGINSKNLSDIYNFEYPAPIDFINYILNDISKGNNNKQEEI